MSEPASTSVTDPPLWHEAVSMAARMHAGQVRKDGRTPYASHPLRVALIVRHEFRCADDQALAAAVLHDVIEDTPADYDDVVERFGEEVAAAVATLTKDMRLPEPERERAYHEGLAAGSWRAALIKCADVLDNLRDRHSRLDTPDAAKQVERCRLALEIASRHADAHECVRRATEALRSVVDAADRGEVC